MNKYLFKCMNYKCGYENYLSVDDDDYRDRMCGKCHRIFKRLKKKLDFNSK